MISVGVFTNLRLGLPPSLLAVSLFTKVDPSLGGGLAFWPSGGVGGASGGFGLPAFDWPLIAVQCLGEEHPGGAGHGDPVAGGVGAQPLLEQGAHVEVELFGIGGGHTPNSSTLLEFGVTSGPVLASGGRPIHELVAAALRKRIRRKEWRDGDKLPSTSRLTAEFGVAAATITGAIELLKAEGYVIGKRGSGRRVRVIKPLVVSSAAYIEPQPQRYSYDILQVVEMPAPGDVAEVFGAGPVVLRYRMMRYDGEPVELSWSYYPANLANGTDLARNRKIRGGAPRVLAELGEPQGKVVDHLSARQPDTNETELLEIPRGVPVLEQLRVIYSVTGRPVEVSVLVKAGHRYQLETETPA